MLARFELSYNEVRSAMAQYLSKVLASPISEDDIETIEPDEDEDEKPTLTVAVLDVQASKEGI